MNPRSALPAFARFTAMAGAFALVVTACGSGGSPGGGSPAGGSGSAASAGGSPAHVLALAASQAKRVTSFSATMSIASSGAYASRLAGTLDEQTRPVLLAHQKFTVTAAGTAIPGGMETLLTSDAVYLKMSSLSQLSGKPWIKISFSSLRSSSGADFGPLIRQMQANDPLSFAQLLPAASNVRRAGTATVGGVVTTAYTGTLDPVKALTRLDPSLRKVFAPAFAATGITTDRFTVWVDGQHQIRKLAQVQSGPHARVSSVMVVTSINQPLHIQVPPASETAAMPGM